MKKSYKYLLLLILAIVVFEVGNYGYQMIQVAAGYNAKIMCSCVFVSGRTPESVLAQDIAVSASHFVPTTVNHEKQTATASFLGIKKTAMYLPNRGCTLLSEDVSYNDLFNKKYGVWSPPLGTNDWPFYITDTLDLVNKVDHEKLNEAFDYAFDEPFIDNPRYTRAALVIYKGKIVKEQYGEGFTANTPLLGWSMAKSVTSALVGLLVKDGKLDVNEVADVPEWHQQANDSRSKIKLDDLLHMTSGLAFEEDYSKPSDVNKMLWTKASAGNVAAQNKMAHPPNTNWYYSSGTTNIISQIIRRQFDDEYDYQTFPYKRLFHPLGMNSVTLESDASGTFVGSSFMYATARDWAKFGLLYLNDGVWNGERILPEGWVDYSRKRTPVLKEGYYSAQFWNNAISEPDNSTTPRHWVGVPEDAYYATGFEGQQVIIIPSREVVIVRLGLTADRANWDAGKFAAMVLEGLPE